MQVYLLDGGDLDGYGRPKAPGPHRQTQSHLWLQSMVDTGVIVRHGPNSSARRPAQLTSSRNILRNCSLFRHGGQRKRPMVRIHSGFTLILRWVAAFEAAITREVCGTTLKDLHSGDISQLQSEESLTALWRVG
jgi:hypothetical protein